MSEPVSERPILVIEDDPAIRELVIGALEDDGFEVLSASDGEDGLASIRQRPPALILLDLRMPNLGGTDFVERYRQTPPPHSPIVVMTAANLDVQSSIQPLVDAVIAKPFDIEDLLSTVSRLMKRPDV